VRVWTEYLNGDKHVIIRMTVLEAKMFRARIYVHGALDRALKVLIGKEREVSG
jgi:hypothetical protein